MNNKLSIAFYFLAAGLVSCGMRKIYLADGRTDVPKNTTKAYKNRVKFDAEVLKDIDTGIVYQAIGDYHMDSFWVGNTISSIQDTRLMFLRFYSNGFMNEFIIDTTKLTHEKFDPTYSGSRGIYYRKGKYIKGEILGPINQLYHMGKVKYFYEVKGDTLIMSQGRTAFFRKVFIKKKLPPEYLMYLPDFSKTP